MASQKLVIIGSSGGGPPILEAIFKDLPKLKGSIILIQHMPQYINQQLADSLNKITNMTVTIAKHGEEIKDGMIYVAPSEQHLYLVDNLKIALREGEKVHYACPSVDVTMKSLQPSPDLKVLGIILTGIGNDGAEGIAHVKELGGLTIAQDEESSIIFGMPREAINTGKVDWVLNTHQIRNKLILFLGL